MTNQPSVRNKGFLGLFAHPYPVCAMLHLGGETDEGILQQAKQEIRILYENGVDAVIVENYFGKPHHCKMVLEYLEQSHSDKVYGVNILDKPDITFQMAKDHKAKFIQIDSVCAVLKTYRKRNGSVT